MKKFFKYVCATVVGLFIAIAIVVILSMLSLVSMASMGSATTNVKDNSVLVIQLQGIISERSEENPFA
jgi:protease-4